LISNQIGTHATQFGTPDQLWQNFCGVAEQIIEAAFSPDVGEYRYVLAQCIPVSACSSG
jgi:hypothetical protein